ncbi:hypothetical protein PENSPDRAFT_148826 [Peniophora sp. CONT]|nr:hypothetical protein PENSPDRAFT_148826 [Peniophora sp. CONT]
MFSSSLRVAARNAHPARLQSRSLVSTVLLNRSWETESVVTLRDELKKRGLSARGNKATLITRIRDHETEQTSPAAPTPSAPAQARSASTTAAPAASSPTPPPPPTATPINNQSYSVDTLNVQLPDLSKETYEEPVQIPLYFDFYDSAKPNSASTNSAPTEIPIPKILVVGGDSTKAAASNMVSVAEDAIYSISSASTSQTLPPNTASGLRGLYYDVLDDLGLPRTLSLPAAKEAIAEATASAQTLVADGVAANVDKGTVHPKSRDLTDDERKGAWGLVGILVGSFIGAGILGPKPVAAEKTSASEHH